MTEQIQKRIAELKATPRALIGSDEGTHAGPTYYSVYMEIDGRTYAVKSRTGTVFSVDHAEQNTAGRIRRFSGEISKMRSLQAELAQLQSAIA